MLRTLSALLISCLAAAPAHAGNAPDNVQTPNGAVPSDGSARGDYDTYFFLGFRHVSGGTSAASLLQQTAYMRGEAFWRERPSERAQVFAAHGYVPVERTGFWSRGFERNAFETDDGEVWWMDPVAGGPWGDTGLVPSGPRTHVHITGYLSPKGHYGHIGGYEREVLVTSGARIAP